MTNKKLTPAEILRALAGEKYLCDDVHLFKLVDGCLCHRNIMDRERYFTGWDEGLTSFVARDLYIFTPPPKPKNLLERFAERFSVELTYDCGHLYTNYASGILKKVAYWLYQQPESRIKEKPKSLSERFKESWFYEINKSNHIDFASKNQFYDWLKEQEDE